MVVGVLSCFPCWTYRHVPLRGRDIDPYVYFCWVRNSYTSSYVLVLSAPYSGPALQHSPSICRGTQLFGLWELRT